MNIDFIGVPLDLGSERIGVDMGPNALRYQNYLKNLIASGLNIEDLGNINCVSPEETNAGDPKIKYLEPIKDSCTELEKKVFNAVSKGRKVLVAGGDHSIAIGSISGASNAVKNLGLIWIDAHGDLNTKETTPSGNIHGMPLAVVLGHGDKSLVSIANKPPAIKYENLVLVGVKDLDPGEIDLIKEKKLNSYSIKNILSEGLQPTLNAIDNLATKTDGIWISLDLDGIDAEYAPGVGMPNKGGLTYREIHAVFEHIKDTCNVVGMDLVEYNPVNDIRHKTAILATELTAKAFGKDFSWYTEYLKHQGV